MNTLQKTAGAILSLSLLCGMQVYAFPDYPSLRGQIIEQSDICQGVVKDANGESIIGASVLVKGTTNGSITGLDGDFSLRNVKKGDIIVVSYVGYQSQEIAWTLPRIGLPHARPLMVWLTTAWKMEADRSSLVAPSLMRGWISVLAKTPQRAAIG